jgi:hypothetical protein
VKANAEQIETRSGTLNQTIEQRKIIELPLNGPQRRSPHFPHARNSRLQRK